MKRVWGCVERRNRYNEKVRNTTRWRMFGVCVYRAECCIQNKGAA